VGFGAIAQVNQILNTQAPDVRFDWVLGRNALGAEPEKEMIALNLGLLLQPQGHIALAETLPRQSQRLYNLVPQGSVANKLMKRWMKAEEQIYSAENGDPSLNWDIDELLTAFQSAGFKVHCEVEQIAHDLYITPHWIERWFRTGVESLSYGDRLGQKLSQAEVAQIREVLAQNLLHKTVRWGRAIAYITAAVR
jgi:putative ATPase